MRNFFPRLRKKTIETSDVREKNNNVHPDATSTANQDGKSQFALVGDKEEERKSNGEGIMVETIVNGSWENPIREISPNSFPPVLSAVSSNGSTLSSVSTTQPNIRLQDSEGPNINEKNVLTFLSFATHESFPSTKKQLEPSESQRAREASGSSRDSHELSSKEKGFFPPSQLHVEVGAATPQTIPPSTVYNGSRTESHNIISQSSSDENLFKSESYLSSDGSNVIGDYYSEQKLRFGNNDEGQNKETDVEASTGVTANEELSDDNALYQILEEVDASLSREKKGSSSSRKHKISVEIDSSATSPSTLGLSSSGSLTPCGTKMSKSPVGLKKSLSLPFRRIRGLASSNRNECATDNTQQHQTATVPSQSKRKSKRKRKTKLADPPVRGERLPGHRTALLAIDLQNDFLGDDPSLFFGKMGSPISSRRAALLDRIGILAEEVRGMGGVVVFIRSMYGAWSAPDGGACMDHVDCCGVGSQGAQFHPDAAKLIQEQDIVITKEWYSGFMKTLLHQILRRLEVSSVVVCGLTTNHSVAATVRSASRLGYQVILSSDGTAQVDPANQQKTVETLSPYCTNVLKGDQTVQSVVTSKKDVPSENLSNFPVYVNGSERISGLGSGDSVLIPNFLSKKRAKKVFRRLPQSANVSFQDSTCGARVANLVECNEQGQIPVFEQNDPLTPWEPTCEVQSIAKSATITKLRKLAEQQSGHSFNWARAVLHCEEHSSTFGSLGNMSSSRCTASSVAVFSLGKEGILNLLPKPGTNLTPQRLAVHHNSLLLFGPDTLRDFTFSLDEFQDDESVNKKCLTRLELTFQDLTTYDREESVRRVVPAVSEEAVNDVTEYKVDIVDDTWESTRQDVPAFRDETINDSIETHRDCDFEASVRRVAPALGEATDKGEDNLEAEIRAVPRLHGETANDVEETERVEDTREPIRRAVLALRCKSESLRQDVPTSRGETGDDEDEEEEEEDEFDIFYDLPRVYDFSLRRELEALNEETGDEEEKDANVDRCNASKESVTVGVPAQVDETCDTEELVRVGIPNLCREVGDDSSVRNVDKVSNVEGWEYVGVVLVGIVSAVLFHTSQARAVICSAALTAASALWLRYSERVKWNFHR